MAITEYDRGDIFYRGSVLAEAHNGSIAINNGAQDVMTIRKGYAGFSKGSLVGTITVSFAVARSGMEADFIEVITKQRAVKFQCVVGGMRFEVEGPIKGTDIKFGENSTASADLTIHGSLKFTKIAA